MWQESQEKKGDFTDFKNNCTCKQCVARLPTQGLIMQHGINYAMLNSTVPDGPLYADTSEKMFVEIKTSSISPTKPLMGLLPRMEELNFLKNFSSYMYSTQSRQCNQHGLLLFLTSAYTELWCILGHSPRTRFVTTTGINLFVVITVNTSVATCASIYSNFNIIYTQLCINPYYSTAT